MIFVQINLSGKPEAIIEIVLILLVAAFLGYAISRLPAVSRIRLLKEEIEEKQIELAERRSVLSQEPVRTLQPVHVTAADPVSVTKPVISTPDNLKMIEGIGPRIEEILNKHDINTFAALADTNPVRISAILKGAGARYQIHDPSSWPQQATYARDENWQELDKLKLLLISGKRVN